MEPTRLSPEDLIDAARDLARQSYALRPPIDGVMLGEVPVFRGPDGLFTETMRIDATHAVEGLPGFRPIQWNWSLLEPGAVKAWHVHLNQEDLWIVPPDSAVLVGLVDLRRGSPTASNLQRLTFGAGRCHRLLIPRGVAHGVANLTLRPQAMMYAVNQFFSASPAEADEWRLPWNRFGEGIWTMDKG